MNDEFSKRFKAVLARRGVNLTECAQRCGVNPAYLTHVLRGRSPLSDALSAKLQAELGAEGWAYALGETDLLRGAAA